MPGGYVSVFRKKGKGMKKMGEACTINVGCSSVVPASVIVIKISAVPLPRRRSYKQCIGICLDQRGVGDLKPPF